MDTHDTTWHDRRLMAQGHTPIHLAVGPAGCASKPRLFLYFASNFSAPNRGGTERILAFQPLFLDFAEQSIEDADVASGDLYLIEIPTDGASTILRLLDRDTAVTFGPKLSIEQIAAYAGNFLQADYERTPEEAAERAIANLEKAGSINWFNLHADMLNVLAEDAGMMNRPAGERTLASVVGEFFALRLSLNGNHRDIQRRELVQLVAGLVTLALPMYVRN